MAADRVNLYRLKLQTYWEELLDVFAVELLDRLVSNFVVSRDEYEQISTVQGNRAQMRAILQAIQRKPNVEVYESFVHCLEQIGTYSQIVTKLNNDDAPELAQAKEKSFETATVAARIPSTNEIAVCMGGWSRDVQQPINSGEYFNGVEWCPFPSMCCAREGAGMVVLEGESIVVAGGLGSEGEPLSSCEKIDLVQRDQKWFFIQSMPKAACDLALVSIWKFLFAIGGLIGGFVSNQVCCYINETDTWQIVQSLNIARYKLCAVAVSDAVMAIGGCDANSNVTATVEVYSTVNGTWTLVSEMRYARKGAKAVEMDGKVFVIGGEDQQNQCILAVEAYDTAADQWTGAFSAYPTINSAVLVIQVFPSVRQDRLTMPLSVNSQLPSPTRNLSAAVFQGQIFICGGESAVEDDNDTGKRVDTLNLISRQWSKLPSMKANREAANVATVYPR